MNVKKLLINKYHNYKFLLWILFIGIFLRVYYLLRKSGDLFVANLGGDSCYHYNVAHNIANGIGAKTSFIFSYWFYHPEIPALTDLYGPGYAFYLSLFLHHSDSFFNLRLANFILGLVSIVLAYIVGKKIKSSELGLICAFCISINFFHIENSTVVIREIFTLVITQFFFLILFILDRKNIYFYIIGFIIGYISITTGIWPIYLLVFFVYIIINKISISLKSFLYLTLGFLTSAIYWIIITKKYFGIFYYSNLKFYPYVKEWSRMMLDKGFPQIENFWTEINLFDYFTDHFFWLLNNIYKASLILSPTFLFPLFFLLIPLCIYGAIKLKKKGFVLIAFSVLYFLGLSFASYGLNGNLWPRHFLPLLFTVSTLLSAAVIPVIEKVKNKIFFLEAKKIIYILIIPIVVTLIGIEYKTSYWEKNDKPFYAFGNKINKITDDNSVILYSVAVPDLWCSSKRKIVHDIAKSGDKVKSRLISDVNKYNVTHLFIDLSEENYKYSELKLKNILKNYQNISLNEVLADKKNGYFFFKIFKN